MSEELEERPNAANRKAVKESGDREKRAEKQKLDDLKLMLEQPFSRRFLIRLMFEDCALYQTSYHPSGQQFAANEGRRGVAVELMAELMKADLDGYLSLLREHQVKPPV